MSCEFTRAWLAAPSSSPEANAKAMAHLARCAACRARFQGYADFTRACGEVLAHAPSSSEELSFLAAARRRGALEPPPSEAPRGARRGWARGLTAAALVAVALLAGWRWSARRAAIEAPAPARLGSVSINRQGVVDTHALRVGETISTTAASTARVEASSNAALELGASTEARISAWDLKHTRILLEQGTVHARVRHRQAGEIFEIVTPNCRVVVVGTVFSVSHARGETLIVTESGRVRVEGLEGGVLGFVGAGERLQIGAPEPSPIATPTPIEAPAPSVVATREARAPRHRRRAPRAPRRRARAPQQHTPPRASPKPTPPEPEPATPEPATPEPATPEPATEAHLDEARRLLGLGEDARAITLLEASPPSWRRDALLGDAYQLGGRRVEATAAYVKAVERAPHPPAALLADLARLQAPEAASGTWRRYLARYPRGLEAPIALLSLAERAPSIAEREGLLARVLEGFPRSRQAHQALTLLGGARLEARRWIEAERLFKPFVERRDVVGETALVGLCRAYIGRGALEAARGALRRYSERFPEGARRREMARLAEALGE